MSAKNGVHVTKYDGDGRYPGEYAIELARAMNVSVIAWGAPETAIIVDANHLGSLFGLEVKGKLT